MTSVNAANQSALPDASGEAVAKASTDSLANQEAFLQMLIAQIQNQDPLNPTDGVQFLTQLSQFSQLEQTIGIREDLQTIETALSSTADETSQSE